MNIINDDNFTDLESKHVTCYFVNEAMRGKNANKFAMFLSVMEISGFKFMNVRHSIFYMFKVSSRIDLKIIFILGMAGKNTWVGATWI